MVKKRIKRVLGYTKKDLLLSIYLFGNALVVFPMFTGSIIMPFLMEVDASVFIKFLGLWWIIVGFVNAIALYFIKKGEMKRAMYVYILSAFLGFITGAAFWISFFITLICISLIHKYERM